MKLVLFLRRTYHLIGILTLLAVSLGTAGPVAAQPSIYSYANGISLAASVPLPVFKLATIDVNAASTLNLTQLFNGIYDRSDPGQDSFMGHTRFTNFNQTKNTLLEQFSATGGFYAYNPTRAYGKAVNPGATLDILSAERNACQFLFSHSASLVPASADLLIPGLSDQCPMDQTFYTDYKVSTEFLTDQSNAPGAPTNQSTNTPLRLMVTLPIMLQTGQFSPNAPPIPLSGPGGHISMIFDDTAVGSKGPSLDSSVVGLQALAMPAFGRSLGQSRLVPAVDPAQARLQVLAQVKDAFPGATNINVPAAELGYFISDAGTPQGSLEPDLIFTHVTLDLDGVTQTLKDISMPGVGSGSGGAGPTVTILSPLNGAAYQAGKPVSLQANVADGQPPYTYDWQLEDGTSLANGPLAAPGALPLVSKSIPTPDAKVGPGSLTIRLVVTDSEGITRSAVVSLKSPVPLFLPLVGRNASASADLQRAAPAPKGAGAVNSVYSFGVEYGSDYPPYGPGGPDLGGVPPDANGLSSGLFGLGWPRIYNWYNAAAWERDWRDCSLGGSDCTYGVDRADYVYYSGHGNNGGIAVPSNSHDSGWFDGANARFQNARWVGFSSCLTLRAQWPTPGAEPIRRWFNAFQGAHMLLGFNSTMGDVAFGPLLVDNMRIPLFLGFIEEPWAQRTIAEAWVQTAFEMNAGKPAYIYATSLTVDPSGNKLPKVTDPPLPRPYPVNWFYWVWWNE